jgi:hypothetical protein
MSNISNVQSKQPRTRSRVIQTRTFPSEHGFNYHIESGVEFPTATHRRNFSNFPFDRMKKDDSFIIPEEAFALVRAAAYQYNRQAKEDGMTDKRGHPLAIRKMPNGEYRCWRIS